MPYFASGLRTSFIASRSGLTKYTHGSSFSHAKRCGRSSGVHLGTFGFRMSYRCQAKLITLSKRKPTSMSASKRPSYGSSHMVNTAHS